MRSYLRVFKNTFAEYFIFRFNFILWRFRVVIQILTLYFFWMAVFASRGQIFGYGKTEMITYVILTLFLTSFVLATGTNSVGEEINSGELTNYLIRPISYFGYWASRDLVDKFFNVFFAVVEGVLLFLILRPLFFLQTDILWLALFVLAVILSAGIYFIISFLIGSAGFWTSEVWGVRFIFGILIAFFSGAFFPLDILPREIYNILSLLPFSYLIYFPIKIYLGKLSLVMILKGFLVMVFWLIGLRKILDWVWKKGLASYTAEGR